MNVIPNTNPRNVSAKDIRNRNNPELKEHTLEIKTSVDGLGKYLGSRIETLQEYIENSEKKALVNKRGPYRKKEKKEEENNKNLDTIAKNSKEQLELAEQALKVQKEQLEEQKEAEYREKHKRKFSLRNTASKVKETGGKIIGKVKEKIPNTPGGIVQGILKLIAAGYLLKKFWPLIQEKFIPFMKDTVLPWMKNTMLPWMLDHWKEMLGGLAIMSFIKSPLQFMMAPLKLALSAKGFIFKGVINMFKGLLSSGGFITKTLIKTITSSMGKEGTIGKKILSLFSKDGSVGKKIRSLIDKVKSVGTHIKEAAVKIKSALPALSEAAPGLAAGIDKAKEVGGVIGNKASKLGGGIGKVASGAGKFAKMGMKGLMVVLKGVARFIPFLGWAVMAFDLIDAFFPNFWSSIKEMFSWENIQNTATKIWDFVTDSFNSVSAWISEKFSASGLAEVGATIWDKVKLGISKIGDWIAEKFTNIGAFFEEKVRSIAGDTIGDWVFGEKKPEKKIKTKEPEQVVKVTKKDELTKLNESIAVINNNVISAQEKYKSGKITQSAYEAILNANNSAMNNLLSQHSNILGNAAKNDRKLSSKAVKGKSSTSNMVKSNQTKPSQTALSSNAIPKSSANSSPNSTKVANTVKPKKGTKKGVQQGDKILFDRIAKGEGTLKNGYNTTFSYGKYDPTDRPITTMTLGEIAQFQEGMLANGAKSTAVGKYQFIRKTFQEVKKGMGLGDNVLFDANTQDAMVAWRLNKTRKMNKWKTNGLSDDKFQLGLAQEFASIADPRTGKSYYGQPTGTSTNEIRTAMAEVKGSETTMPSSFNEGTALATNAASWRNEGTATMVGADKKESKSVTDIINEIDRDALSITKSALSGLGILNKDGSIVKGVHEKGKYSVKDSLSKLLGNKPANKTGTVGGIFNDIDREAFGLLKSGLNAFGITNEDGSLTHGKAELKSKTNTGKIEVSPARQKLMELDAKTKNLAAKTAVKDPKPVEPSVTHHNTIIPPQQSDNREKVTLENTAFEDFTLSQIGILY